MIDLPAKYAELVAKWPELAVTDPDSGTLIWNQGWGWTDGIVGESALAAEGMIHKRLVDALPDRHALWRNDNYDKGPIVLWMVRSVDTRGKMRCEGSWSSSPLSALFDFHLSRSRP